MLASVSRSCVPIPPPAHGKTVNQVSLSSDTPGCSTTAKSAKPVRLAYFVSHPIQYQAPLLRRIAEEPDIDLTVFFSSDISVRGYHDQGFGVRVQWDVPLLDGYRYEFLPRLRDSDHFGFATPLNYGIFRRLRRGRFDAAWVFGYSRLACLQAIFAARLLGIPVILRAESNLHDRPRTRTKLAAKKIFSKVLGPAISCVLPIGKANESYWKHYLGDQFPMFPMPYAVDNDFFRRGAVEAHRRRQEFRRELGLEPGRPVILYASKLQNRKRCIDLLEAYIRQAPASGVDPSAYLLIVGDGEERSSLENRVRVSGLSSIRFLGFRNQTELPRFYDLCDLFVLPSIHETWGLIVNEVMNAGRAIIVTDHVGCGSDLVHDGVNGFVYPAFDVDALSVCLRRLIEDPALCTRMGENSLRIIERYSFEEDVAGLRGALALSVPEFLP
jgi:glycosyltransferase involved in cell wall biosynthesis